MNSKVKSDEKLENRASTVNDPKPCKSSNVLVVVVAAVVGALDDVEVEPRKVSTRKKTRSAESISRWKLTVQVK